MMSRVAVGLLIVLLGAVGRAEIIDRVLAILPGQIITQSDVQAALELGLVEALPGEDPIAAGLSSVVDRVLMLNEVRRIMPRGPTDAAVDARVARMRQRFESPQALARVLAASGIDDSVLRIYAADDLRLTAYLDERFSAASQPTEAEVREAGEGARARLAAERRRSLISAWVAELRRRADVTIVPR